MLGESMLALAKAPEKFLFGIDYFDKSPPSFYFVSSSSQQFSSHITPSEFCSPENVLLT
jgi:hypothetical protein